MGMPDNNPATEAVDPNKEEDGCTVGSMLAGMLVRFGPAYYLGLAGAVAAALRQQWLIRNREKDGCFKAFLNNNLFGMSIFIGILLEYLLRGS